MSDLVPTPEFSRMADIRAIDTLPVHLVASERECAGLARRFAIVSVQKLEARIALEKQGDTVVATGTMDAQFVQSCAISADDLPVTVHETLNLRFVPATAAARIEAEIELEAKDLDVIDFNGTAFDLGEAVAQTLALAIDPFLEGPQADRVRRELGLNDPGASGPFAALAALKKN
ncbi:MAG: DUF177 domain-containing protein [Novosphingobium sp.]